MNPFPQHVFHDPSKMKQKYDQPNPFNSNFDPLSPPLPDSTKTKISTEALKQREGRNKRAICNRELLLLALSCGAEIIIDKTKKTSRAKKVFVGNTIIFDGEYHISEILENAYYFECAIRTLWKKAKTNYESSLQLSSDIVTSEMDNVRLHPEIIKAMGEDFKIESCEGAINSVGKRRTKNKEAAFSNFLAYKLIMNGFTLTCQVSAQKITTKTLNFYIWKQFRTPTGRIVTKELLQPYQSMNKEIKELEIFKELGDSTLQSTMYLYLTFAELTQQYTLKSIKQKGISNESIAVNNTEAKERIDITTQDETILFI